jgi:hypothetical protein
MASKLVQRHRSTVLVSERTLNQAMTEARALVQRLGHEDPRSTELKNLYNQIAPHARGKGNTESFDDAYNPQVANMLKAVVDRIAKIRTEVNSPAQQVQPVAEPVNMPQSEAYSGQQQEVQRGHQQFSSDKKATNLDCHTCEAGGFKNQAELDSHVAKDHKGRKASEKVKEGESMSSKLFARKKKHVEAEDELLDAAPEAVPGEAPTEPLPEGGADPAAVAAPAPAPAPVAPPAGAPPTAGNPFANLPTEALSVIVEALTKIDMFESNPAILGAIENVAEELKNRPVAPAADPNAPKAASRKKAEDAIKQAVAPEGWEGTVKEMKNHKEIDNPYALANYMKDEGYTSHKASFMLKRGRAAWLQAKLAAASVVPPVNEDTLNKVDGQPHEVAEINEAHGKREGVDKAETHDSHPGTSGTDIKSPQDMEKQAGADSEVSKALKTAETLEKKLGELYMDAKPMCRANASAAVRDAVESIYDAKNKFAEAKKVLNKHEMQANAEKEAQDKALDKKASVNTLGLSLVGAE